MAMDLEITRMPDPYVSPDSWEVWFIESMMDACAIAWELRRSEQLQQLNESKGE
jgi:hypothetical protein